MLTAGSLGATVDAKGKFIRPSCSAVVETRESDRVSRARLRPATIAVCLWALCAARARADEPDKCLSGLIYVGEVDLVDEDSRLGELVATRVVEGMRFKLASPDARIASYYELRTKFGTEAIQSLQVLYKTLSVRVERAFRAMVGATNHKATAPRMTAYVQTTLVRTASATSVDLALYCIGTDDSKPATIRAKKTATALDGSDSVLLERAFAAAGKLTSLSQNAPVARVAGSWNREVGIDTHVVLDASPSSDPDDDTIVIEWEQLPPEHGEVSPGQRLGWRQEDGKVIFLASPPGTYTFRVKVSKLLAHNVADEAVVRVRVVRPPQVTVDDAGLVLMRGVTKLPLRGTCLDCDSWRWEQVSGPDVVLPKKGCLSVKSLKNLGPAETRESQAECIVEATIPGDYVFAMVGQNALGTDRKEESFGLAPPPVAVVEAPLEAVVDQSYPFDASASHDVFGGTLRYHWELSESPFVTREDSCAPVDAALPAGVRLTQPTLPVTEFISHRTGSYYMRLTVVTDRKFGGQPSADARCTVTRLVVRDPAWLPFVVAGGDYHMSGGNPEWEGFRLKFGLTVRPFASRGWFGLRASQVVISTEKTSSPHVFGGTTFGPAFMIRNSVQINTSLYLRNWGARTVGPAIGVDVRVARCFVISAEGRYDVRDGKDQVVLGGYLGGGLNL